MNLLFGKLFRRTSIRRTSNSRRRQLRPRTLGVEPLERRELLSVVSIIPAKDNSIYSGYVNNSNAKGLLYTGLNNDGTNIKRALMDFNVAAAVPAGSIITGVTLTMYCERNNNGATATDELHKLTKDWGEGTSMAGTLTKNGGQGTAATTNDATWKYDFYNTSSWATPGGDFSPTISGSTSIAGPGGTGSYTWASTAQMVADVQSWLDNPSANFGWLLKASAADELVNSSHAFYPREATNATQRPTLTITYTTAATNLPPTLNAISNPAAINENAGLQTVNLSGITAGAGQTEALSVTATSSNTALIPNPTVNYTSPAATGSLTFTPVANQYGMSTITVTVHNAGLDGILGNADDGTTMQMFTVTVNQVNQVNLPPTLNAIPNPAAINENAGLQTVSLSGISAGAGETQALQVTATSSNTALIPNPTVSYTSPAATGSLTYTPVANQYGTSMVTVTVRDAGLDGVLGNADDGIATQTFTVTVNQVNLPPTLNAIPNPAAINENAGLQTVNLSGITAGAGQTEALSVTATSSNTALIPNPTVNYTSPAATGSLTYTPVANQYGMSTITVTVHNAGLDGILGNADDGTTMQMFTVTVNQVNQVNLPPTLNAISNPAAINENAGLQTVSLSGISAGAGETQALQVTATSSNTALIPNPTVSYTSPAATGSLTYTPVANQYGTSMVTVTVRDAGLDGVLGNADDGIATQTFTVTVNQVNLPPTLNAIPNPAAINENAGLQTVNLSGITAGAGQTEALSVTATSSNTALIPNPTVNYTSPAATGSLTYTPVANQYGMSTITVTVHNAGLDGILGNADDGTTMQMFTVTVNQVNQVNLPPTLNAIPNPAAINENAGLQTVSLSGISAGAGETQALQVTATSSNTALIPNPTVSYTSPAATGSLTYTPVANQYGTSMVTVTVRDAGLDGVLGNADDGIATQTFTVTVNQVNLPPTLNAIPNPAAINENAGLQTVNLSGITAGAGQTEALSVTATSSNTALIPNPTVSYTSPAATGSLSYTPVANKYGTATITVSVHNAGLDGILGNADDGIATQTFTVTVNQVNQPPTLNAISNPAAINENAGLQMVNLSGITAGAGQTEALSVTATSSNTALIPNPTVSYTSPAATGSLSYTPVANKYGTATITVSVHNAGLDGILGNADDGIATQTFTVTVNQVNLPPTLNAISNPAAINENAGLQTVSLSGISAGAGETQALQVTATSSNTALIPNPTVSYTSPAATGSLTYTPVANKYGTATITVTVHDAGLDGILGNADDGTATQTFTVTVNQVNQVNLPPALNAISNPAAINENAGLQTVNLSGITAGAGQTEALSVTATSSNTALIPNPTVSYTSPAATGSLSYTPVANKYDTATITVSVHNAGLDGTLGTADDGTATQTFTVTVNQVVASPAYPSICLLSPTAVGALTLHGSSSIAVPGKVEIDSRSSAAIMADGSTKVTASAIDVVGRYLALSHAALSPKPNTQAASLADPLAKLVAPSAGTYRGAVDLSTGSRTISPGSYDKIRVSGSAHLILNPGVYIVGSGGFQVSGTATVTGSGVLVYVGGTVSGRSGASAAVSITGSAKVTLTAPTTGPYVGVALFQARTDAHGLLLSDYAVVSLPGGMLYAPTAKLTERGHARLSAPLIASALELDDYATESIAAAGSGGDGGSGGGDDGSGGDDASVESEDSRTAAGTKSSLYVSSLPSGSAAGAMAAVADQIHSNGLSSGGEVDGVLAALAQSRSLTSNSKDVAEATDRLLAMFGIEP